MTKYYVDNEGAYVGAYDGAEPPDGSIEVGSVPDDARQLWDGQEWGGIPYTWADVATLQNEMFSSSSYISKRIARYKLQKDHTGQTTKESDSKYQEMLQHFQDIRDSDETTYATPQEALDALNALVEPTE